MRAKNIHFDHLMVFLFSATTMLLEILLVKTCNVIIYATAGFFLLTMALFFLSLSGAFVHYLVTVQKLDEKTIFKISALAFGLVASLSLPILRLFPLFFDFKIESSFAATLFVVLLISLPFLFSGTCILLLLTGSESKSFQVLYAFDLLGVVAVIVLPRLLISYLGPDILMAGMLVLWLVGLSFYRFTKFANPEKFVVALLLLFNIFIVVTVKPAEFFRPYVLKYMPQSLSRNKVEMSIWDPIARIDVVDFTKQTLEPGIFKESKAAKYIFYDGGTIGTNIYPYDGNATRLLNIFQQEPNKYFLRLSTVASHLLKKDSNYSAYLFGVGAGQEVKAALIFGAKKIYANELVQSMIDLDKNEYAFYNGNIFNSDKVQTVVGDGRLELSRLSEKFDIIQIFSNYLSSNMASGMAAFQASYLFTQESMNEYIDHLSEDGILQINQFKYERILDLIAKSYVDHGRSLQDLKKHILVIGNEKSDDIYTTILFKKSIFSENEVNIIKELLMNVNNPQYQVIESPYIPEPSYLTELKHGRGLANHYVASDSSPYFSSDDSLSLHFYGLNKLAYFSLFAAAFFLVIFLLSRVQFNPSSALTGSIYFVSGAAFIFMQVGLVQIILKYLNWPDMAFPLVVGGLCAGIGVFNLGLHQWPGKIQQRHIQLGLVLLLCLIPLLPFIFSWISQFSNRTACFLFFISFSILGFLGSNIFSFFIDRNVSGLDKVAIYQAWLFQGLGVLVGSMIMHILFIKWGQPIVLAFSVLCSLVSLQLVKYSDSAHKG